MTKIIMRGTIMNCNYCQIYEVPTKKPRTTIYLEPELMQALEERAKEEKRTISNLCNLLIEQAMNEWLNQRKKTNE
jgi:hypothetical protein